MKRLLALVVLTFGTSSLGYAGACGVGTMATYDASGFSCTIDGKTFSGFSYVSSGSGGAMAIPDSGVTVTPCPSALCTALGVPAGEEGFVFTAAWSVNAGQTLDSTIAFTVTGTNIVDARLLASGIGASGNGAASVAEDLSNGTSLFVSLATGTSATATFAPVTSLTVVKDIAVNGNDGTAAISAVVNSFSQTETRIPEPGTLGLLGTGLLVLGSRLRRRLGL